MSQRKKDIFWMQKALFLTKKAQANGEIPTGAVLIHKDKLIADGWNHSIINNDPCAHAEILALRAGGQYFKNYRLLNTTLYVTLEPCFMCVGAMIHARIYRLVYGAYNYKFSTTESAINIFNHPKINHHILVSKGVLADECSAVLSCFFKQLRMKKSNKKLF